MSSVTIAILFIIFSVIGHVSILYKVIYLSLFIKFRFLSFLFHITPLHLRLLHLFFGCCFRHFLLLLYFTILLFQQFKYMCILHLNSLRVNIWIFFVYTNAFSLITIELILRRHILISLFFSSRATFVNFPFFQNE